MTLVDRIRVLANERGMSLPDLEIAIGLGNGTISRWKNSSPNTDKLTKVADYLEVSVDFLLGRELTTQDEKDIQKKLNKIMADIKNKQDSPLYYNGEEIDDTSLELLADALESAMRQMKIINKVKFNPNKNKE